MRRVLVTGANKGIGRATVAAILEQGEDTFALLGSRDRGRGEEAKAALVEGHPDWEARIHVLQIDVSDDASVTRAAAEVKERFGGEDKPLYGIVNNAGIMGGAERATVLEVNVYGIHRVCEAFVPMLVDGGRVVNVTSAAGPNFVNKCSAEQQAFFLDKDVTWEALSALMEECKGLTSEEDFASRGLSDGASYGLSKACANSLTLLLARQNPHLTVNACTPGFIETDLTRHYATSSGRTPEEMGMKTPKEGTRSPIFLLFGSPQGSGHYYGSDAERSPLDRYRAPGDPPYEGD